MGGHGATGSLASAVIAGVQLRARRKGDRQFHATTPLSSSAAAIDEPDVRRDHSLAGRGGSGGGLADVPRDRCGGPRQLRRDDLSVRRADKRTRSSIAAIRANGRRRLADALLQPARRCADGHTFAAAEVIVGEPQVRPATAREIEADWREFTGGPPVVGVLREYEAAGVEGIVWHDEAIGGTGVVTWGVEGERAEIGSGHAEPQGGGPRTRIMDAAEAELRG